MCKSGKIGAIKLAAFSDGLLIWTRNHDTLPMQDFVTVPYACSFHLPILGVVFDTR